jgi:hypothetical protein
MADLSPFWGKSGSRISRTRGPLLTPSGHPAMFALVPVMVPMQTSAWEGQINTGGAQWSATACALEAYRTWETK